MLGKGLRGLRPHPSSGAGQGAAPAAPKRDQLHAAGGDFSTGPSCSSHPASPKQQFG